MSEISENKTASRSGLRFFFLKLLIGNPSFLIAQRYLFSKKKTNIINIISAISSIGVAVGTIALVVTLSVFNGFENLINSFFTTFDPDLKVEAVRGKTFDPSGDAFDSLRNMEGIVHFSEVLEDQALLYYGEQQLIATVKGVDEEFIKMTNIESAIIDGRYGLDSEDREMVLMGSGVARNLSVGLNFINPVHFYYPKRGKGSALSLSSSFKKKYAYPSGIFSIQQDLDMNYVLVRKALAEELFQHKTKISAVELMVENGYDIEKVKRKIKVLLGPDFQVRNRLEQHASLYKTLKGEKWAIYLILSFILVIASFNVVGSLTMLIIDKKKDIAILRSMGASQKLIRNIFLYEGWSISMLGATGGLIIGVLVCWLQESFGLVKLQGVSMIIDAYPIHLIWTDILAIYATVLMIGFLASYFPIRFIKMQGLNSSDSPSLV